jgi:anti-sigma B factor antagonist
MTSRAPKQFEIVDAQMQNAPAVAVRGEVDVVAAPALELALDGAIRESAGAFVLDLREVEFLDSSGLRLILRARALLAREDRALAIVCPLGPVRRLFTETGIADLLYLYTSPEEVATALVPAG